MDGYTVKQAAAELHVSIKTIQARIVGGKMKAERVGERLWIIPRREVERWRKLGRLAPGPKPATGKRPKLERKQA